MCNHKATNEFTKKTKDTAFEWAKKAITKPENGWMKGSKVENNIEIANDEMKMKSSVFFSAAKQQFNG